MSFCLCDSPAVVKGQCRACYDKERNQLKEIKDRQFAWKLKNRFNMSVEEYYSLLASQNGICAVCGKTPEENGFRLAVDHDHSCCPQQPTCGFCTRGLLCVNCNTALGSLKDDPVKIENLLNYVKGRDYN